MRAGRLAGRKVEYVRIAIRARAGDEQLIADFPYEAERVVKRLAVREKLRREVGDLAVRAEPDNRDCAAEFGCAAPLALEKIDVLAVSGQPEQLAGRRIERLARRVRAKT